MNLTRNGGRLWFLLGSILLSLSLLADAQLQGRYQKWLDEDVRWIVTPQERAAFVRLTTDQQRDEFVTAFWERRNPTPRAAENPFKQEHYRRIAYANVHFAFTSKDKNIPGWKSDRGRIYIVYGPPDSIDLHASAPYQLASGVRTSIDPYEVWSYQKIKGFGEDVTVRFVDKCRCGEFRQASAPSDEHELPLLDSPDE